MVNFRECTGYLIFTNGHKVDAELNTWVSRPKKWFKGRGTLFVELQNLSAPAGKWQVGIFYCTKKHHNSIDHIYSLTATDTGKIIKKEDEKTEKIALNVAATRIDDENENISRPRVHRQ